MRDPAHIVRSAGTTVCSLAVSAACGLQSRMAASLVVVSPELSKRAVPDTGIPEQHIVENFWPHRPDHRSVQTVVAVYLAADSPCSLVTRRRDIVWKTRKIFRRDPVRRQ